MWAPSRDHVGAVSAAAIVRQALHRPPSTGMTKISASPDKGRESKASHFPSGENLGLPATAAFIVVSLWMSFPCRSDMKISGAPFR